ncbi:MAG: VOC family protein [Dehalococcoidia bacterium]|nr:VOC family protein [Dehalococcoidia bacterium]
MFADDAGGLLRLLRDVFGARGELEGNAPAEMRIGDSLILVSGTEYRPPMPACLYVYVEDADESYRLALTAGARSLEAPKDVPYGDRRAMVEDAWGNVWQIAARG